MKKIAITGANGYLASLIQARNSDKFQFIPVTRTQIDLTQPEKIADYFDTLDFDMVLHTAARTQTADCEAHPAETKKINTDSAIELAKACQKHQARFIFISTEQVYNHMNVPGPFTEEQPTDSTSIYGQQKIVVEDFLADSEVDYLTFRLSWMMGLSYPGIKASPNIIKNVMNALFYQKPTKFTVNEMRGLTYANRLVDQLDKLVALPSGTYHFSSENNMSTYEAAKLIGAKLGFSEAVIARYILPDHERYADRFRDLRLDTGKIQAQGIALTTFEEDVEACLRDFGW